MTRADRHHDAPCFVARRRGVSITALIDVVFILLLFFMLSSSFVRRNTIDLAMPALSATAAAETSALQLVLEPDGRLHSVDAALDLGSFRRLSAYAPGADRDVIVRPMPGVHLASIVGASEALLRSGARAVSLGALAVEPPSREPVR